jgi:hypothetical protein
VVVAKQRDHQPVNELYLADYNLADLFPDLVYDNKFLLNYFS